VNHNPHALFALRKAIGSGGYRQLPLPGLDGGLAQGRHKILHRNRGFPDESQVGVAKG
jgi:hypothetical protein